MSEWEGITSLNFWISTGKASCQCLHRFPERIKDPIVLKSVLVDGVNINYDKTKRKRKIADEINCFHSSVKCAVDGTFYGNVIIGNGAWIFKISATIEQFMTTAHRNAHLILDPTLYSGNGVRASNLQGYGLTRVDFGEDLHLLQGWRNYSFGRRRRLGPERLSWLLPHMNTSVSAVFEVNTARSSATAFKRTKPLTKPQQAEFSNYYSFCIWGSLTGTSTSVITN